MANSKKIQEALRRVKVHGWGVIDLRDCGLTKIPEELYNYPEIVAIDLGNSEFTDQVRRNKIKEIPQDIVKIKKLSRLNLENNEIEIVSEEITKLENLKHLNLHNNKLKDLSEKIANMPGLVELILSENPFEMLPPEIIARGINSVRNFFKELKEQDYIFEVKLIIVGEGRVGKTCLSRALIEDGFVLTDEASTEGININRWILPQDIIRNINKKIDRDFQINIWDFGGQEIYHSTHQFFLTKRSIYILVTESRREDSHDDFFYWLNIIKLLGDNSPVMMVLNKCDQPTKELPIKEYQASFNNIISFDKISLKTEYKDGFVEFKNKLMKMASGLPHIGNPLPKVWVDIRHDIEELKLSGRSYISKDEYFEICKKHYRKEDSALFLSEYFHDLGVIIHFQKDVELRDLVVLNHEWITKGVYKILDDKKIINQKGRFTNEDILRIWSDDEYKNQIKELLYLMKNTKFDLCFEIGQGEFLIPRLLPVDEVEHNWDSVPGNMRFEFRYKFMPKGILARLIVKMNSDIFQEKYWRYGVILEYDKTYAIIREKYFENKITIELKGYNKREFLFLIRKSINEIHKDFNKLEVNEMIQCNCDDCASRNSPHFYEFNLLRRYESNNISKIRCPISLAEVPVFELTADVAQKSYSEEKIIVCENQNATLLNYIEIEKTKFFPERDSNSVFMKVKTDPDLYGLRDRDFLLDTEINRIKNKYRNYYILNYYCFENYLYHPDNIEELNLAGFSKSQYINDIINQKNKARNLIISVYKNSRNSYQEFKIESEKIRDKENEDKIIEYLESNEIEIFFKSFSMKDYFKKNLVEKYQLTQKELVSTAWFKKQMFDIIC